MCRGGVEGGARETRDEILLLQKIHAQRSHDLGVEGGVQQHSLRQEAEYLEVVEVVLLQGEGEGKVKPSCLQNSLSLIRWKGRDPPHPTPWISSPARISCAL